TIDTIMLPDEFWWPETNRLVFWTRYRQLSLRRPSGSVSRYVAKSLPDALYATQQDQRPSPHRVPPPNPDPARSLRRRIRGRVDQLLPSLGGLGGGQGEGHRFVMAVQED